MKTLIKSSAHAELSAVRPVGMAPRAAPLSNAERERIALEEEVSRLNAILGTRDAVIAQLRLDAEQAVHEAYENGRLAGLAEAEDRETDRILALQNAMYAALAELKASLASLERLAPLLARDCLEIIFGNPEYRAEIVQAILSRQLDSVAEGAVVDVKVSSADFSDVHVGAALKASVGLVPGTIAVSDKMPAGGCVIALRLGSLQVGVDQQWQTLRGVLEQLALKEDIH